MPTRWAKPGKRCGRASTLPVASRAPFSTSWGCRNRTSSSRSILIRKRRFSRRPTTPCSATCSRLSPRSPRSSASCRVLRATASRVINGERFDVVVVGAGLAGTAAAYLLANAGLRVVCIERGDEPGTKNVMGGVLYRQPTEKVIPGWWREAPIERPIVEERMWMLTEDSMVQAGFKSMRYAEEPYNAFTVLRVKFDKSFADKATAAGAVLVTNTVVEDVIREDGRVVGVRTGREEGE